MISCRLDTSIDLKHPLDILMAFCETDSRLSSSLLLAVQRQKMFDSCFFGSIHF